MLGEDKLSLKSRTRISCKTVLYIGVPTVRHLKHSFLLVDQLPDGNQDMEQDPAVGEGFKKTNHKLLPQVAYVAYQVHRSQVYLLVIDRAIFAGGVTKLGRTLSVVQHVV